MPIATVNPANGQTVKTFEPHDKVEVDRRIAEAADAARQLRGTTFAQRAGWMKAAADLVESETESLARLLVVVISEQAQRHEQLCDQVRRRFPALALLEHPGTRAASPRSRTRATAPPGRSVAPDPHRPHDAIVPDCIKTRTDHNSRHGDHDASEHHTKISLSWAARPLNRGLRSSQAGCARRSA